MQINTTTIETGLWSIERYMMKKYGVDAASRDIAPLKWYVGTERASLAFLRLLLAAKPFMIGRILHKGGSYEDAIQRVKVYLNYCDE